MQHEKPQWMIDHERSDERHFADIKESIDKLSSALLDPKDGSPRFATKTDVQPIIDAWKAIIFSKTFVGGLATVILAISAIGVGISWFINSFTNK